MGVGASPACPIVPTTLLTATVSPSLTVISVRTPAAGEGISASTLSVEISNSGSSRSTVSPTFFIQRTIVPSAIDSPICGINTGVGIGNPSHTRVLIFRQSPRRRHYAGGVRQENGFERRAVRYGGVEGCHPCHGRIQVLERLFGDRRRDFPADAAGPWRLVKDQRAA